MSADPPLLFLDGWRSCFTLMLCYCGRPGCPRWATQCYAESPEERFDDVTDAIAAHRPGLVHEAHGRAQ